MTLDAPLYKRFFRLALDHPLDGDLLALLAGRLAFNCSDPYFLADLPAWRQLQRDLLGAAVGLDTFSSSDRRKSATEALKRAGEDRLCARHSP